jgi:hypothetical protein
LDYVLAGSLDLELANPHLNEQELMDFYYKTISKKVRELAQFISVDDTKEEKEKAFLRVKQSIENFGSVKGLTLLQRTSTSLYRDLDTPMQWLTSQLRLAELAIGYTFSKGKYSLDPIFEELIQRDENNENLDLFFDAIFGTGYGYEVMSKIVEELDPDSVDRLDNLFCDYCSEKGLQYSSLADGGIDAFYSLGSDDLRRRLGMEEEDNLSRLRREEERYEGRRKREE